MQGYLAGVSFLDTQIGRILDLLDELDLWQNTTVVLTSDHGMHNGEKGLWYYPIIIMIYSYSILLGYRIYMYIVLYIYIYSIV